MDDDDDLFIKDGEPVKFCFHRSVHQGRGRITRDIERHGGEIVDNERIANVLLVDEEEDLGLLRRQYYRSMERYRLSIFVEPRGFVQTCIRSGTYEHVAPVKRGMPGRAPGGGGRVRIKFTDADRNYLACYLATQFPTRDGRMGNSAYKDLEELGQTDDPCWEWARRHTWHSWREHYKMRPHIMDPLIDRYVRRLKKYGHHFGEDPRSHDYRNLQRRVVEEEEEEDVDVDEDEEEEEEEEERGQSWGGIQRQRRQIPAPRPRDQVPRDHRARPEELLLIEDTDDDDDGPIVPRQVKRNRVPDARLQHNAPTQPKRARISTDEGQESDAEPTRENTETQESQDIEGSDLFGDRLYENHDDQDVEYPAPFYVGQEGPPPSTQATLVASPRFAEKGLASISRAAMVEGRTQMPAPPSPELTLVMREERAGVRIPIRGTLAEAGPSAPTERRTGGAVAVGTSLSKNRARSQSIEPQAQPRLEDEGVGGKQKPKEEVLTEDIYIIDDRRVGRASTNGGASLAEEKAVEETLEDTDVESDGDPPKPPPYQDIEITDEEPSDSDDKETHGTLARGVAENEPKSEDEDDAARIERMASGKLVAAPAPTRPEPRVTRSKSASQKPQISPRRTRSATQRATSPHEYALPQGTRAARIVRGRAKRQF